jgi:hypothetical protein
MLVWLLSSSVATSGGALILHEGFPSQVGVVESIDKVRRVNIAGTCRVGASKKLPSDHSQVVGFTEII